MVAVPLEELAALALQDVPGIRSSVIQRDDPPGVVVAYEWTGPTQPTVPTECLSRLGLEIA